MSDITCNDFSSGWIPSDDPINGRKNGLLQMDNLELDSNGALQLIGGTSVLNTLGSRAHSIYSRIMNGVRRDYLAHADGSITRNGSSIGTGGDSSNAAFGTAFNFTLVCSGNKRIKDTSGAVVNLGVGAPTAAPVLVDTSLDQSGAYSYIADLTQNYVAYSGAGSATTVTETHYPSGGGHSRPSPIVYLQLTANSDGLAVVQTHSGAGDPQNATKFTPPTGSDYGYALASDVIPFFGYTDVPQGCSLQLDILLTAGNAYADQMENYYTYKIPDLGQLEFDPYTGVFHVYIRRSDFTRVGTTAALDWSATYGVRITFKGSNGQVINILGQTVAPEVAQIIFYGGTHALNGTYDFMQVNVFNTGSYIAKSQLGPILKGVSVIQAQPKLQMQAPGGIDAQINECWLFARSNGGANGIGDTSFLNKWYRIATQSAGSAGSTFITQLGDVEAETLNIFYNQNLSTIASSNISDKIYTILGPINGRWYYFTSNFMYPSDINDPDLIDATIAVRTTGSNSEIFLWAHEIAEGVVLVGTNVDIYILSGTFQTLADGTIDIYYRKLGAKYPPITYDSAKFGGSVYYIANDGWRAISADGSNPLITAPNTDQLYRGNTRYNYTPPNLRIASGATRFPVCVARNKLYCFITGTSRCEVYDFTRKYWRTFNYQLGDVSCTFATQDGQILGFYINDNKLRELEVTSTKLVDGATNQFFTALFCVFDGQLSRNRKDSQTFKARAYSSSGSYTVGITNDIGAFTIVGTVNSPTQGLDKFIDISSSVGIVKTYQVKLTGTVPDFLLEDWVIYFTPRPEQVTYLRVLPNNYGTTARKRISSIPFTIDSLGNTVNVTPIVDSVPQAPLSLIATYKKSFNYEFLITSSELLKGVDYEYILSSTGLFEFFGFQDPRVVEVFPERVKGLQLPVTNFGNASKKRVRVWPFVLSAPIAGTQVTFVPRVDGVDTAPFTTFTLTADRETYFHQFVTDVFGVDYGGFFTSNGEFEVDLANSITPDVVQVLPIAKHFDQVGPAEFFRYGKIKQFEFRLLSFGSPIPFIIYFSDNSSYTGSIPTLVGKEDTYFIQTPKGTSGHIVRLVLGPTNFDFHRYYARVQVGQSGQDTELNWINL